jgi:hypothetical protein
MAIEFRQIDFKLLDQLRNGKNFSINSSLFKNNFSAYVGGKYRVVEKFGISVYWYNNVTNNQLRLNYNDKWIEADDANWIEEGFKVGDKIGYSVESGGTFYTGTAGYITSITSDRIYVDNFDFIFDPNNTGTEITNNKKAVFVEEKNKDIEYSFGFVENGDEYSNNSLLTNASQSFYGGYTSENSLSELTPLGDNKDWFSGQCYFTGEGEQVLNDIYGFKKGVEFFYKVQHDFLFNPFYKEGDISNLTNPNGVIPPDYLIGDASLKYVFKIDLRRTFNNPNISYVYQEKNLLGSTAYYNENYNGFNNNFKISNVKYNNGDLDGINPNETTTVTFDVESLNGVELDTAVANLYVFKCTEETDYTNTTSTNLEQNFLYDNLRTANTTPATGIIKSFSFLSQTLTKRSVTAVISYTQEEQLKIKEGDFFALTIAVTSDLSNNDDVNLLVDVKEYDTTVDIAGLATMPKFDLSPYEGGEFDSIRAFNEDGINAVCQLVLDTTKDAFLNSLDFKLIAYKPTTAEYFDLDSINIPYTEIISNGVQQINYESNRGYPDSITFDKDRVLFKTNSSNASSTTFDLEVGQKINWKDWVYNRFADTGLYDNSKPNNNLNYKASNYSDVDGYEIRLAVLANIYGVDDLGRSGDTDYLFLSQKIEVKDYDSNDELDGQIQLLDSETLTDLGGSPRSDKDTIFKVVWYDLTLSNDNIYTLRIERNDNTGNALFELSSFQDYEGGILKPFDGLNRLKIEQVGTSIEVSGLIDYTKLVNNVSYNLSARISAEQGIDPNAKLKTNGVIKLKTQGDSKLKAL